MIAELIYSVLSPEINVYPVIADIESFEKLTYPYCIYKIRTAPDKRKGEKERTFSEVRLFIATKSYDDGNQFGTRIKDLFENLTDFSMNGYAHSTEFEHEDKIYVTEIDFSIKKR